MGYTQTGTQIGAVVWLARAAQVGRPRGGLRQAYREGQEDQLGALGLVLNAIVLWNTRYMDAAIAAPRN